MAESKEGRATDRKRDVEDLPVRRPAAGTMIERRAAGRLLAGALALGLVIGAPAAMPATTTDARAIVDRVDRLLRGDSSEGEMTMEVVTRRWTRTLTLRA